MNQKFRVAAVFLKDCFGPRGKFFCCAGDARGTRNPHVSARLPTKGGKGKSFSTTKFAPAEITHAAFSRWRRR
jgi:hypothetical protein